MNKAEFLRQFHHIKQIKNEMDFPLKEPGRPAAVLIPILEHADELTVLFTVRSMHLKHHGGQVSFPGGKQEPSDRSLIQTALRESYEEVGILPQSVEIVGNLPRFRTISLYEVIPYIGFINTPSQLILDKNEVHSTFEVPLSYLLDQRNHFIHWASRSNKQFPIYFIPWNIMRMLVSILRLHLSK